MHTFAACLWDPRAYCWSLSNETLSSHIILPFKGLASFKNLKNKNLVYTDLNGVIVPHSLFEALVELLAITC